MLHFLTDLDYKALIKDEHLSILHGANLSTRRRAELEAQKEMESYLRPRYDLAAIFILVDQPYDNTKAYEAGDHVIFDDGNGDKIYIALGDTTGNDPTDTDFWKQGDDRHPVIVMRTVDIALYHLHTNLNPEKIPQLRLDRYDEAIQWLRAVNAGEVTPDLPVPEDDPDLRLKFGSNKKLRHEW